MKLCCYFPCMMMTVVCEMIRMSMMKIVMVATAMCFGWLQVKFCRSWYCHCHCHCSYYSDYSYCCYDYCCRRYLMMIVGLYYHQTKTLTNLPRTLIGIVLQSAVHYSLLLLPSSLAQVLSKTNKTHPSLNSLAFDNAVLCRFRWPKK